MDVIHLMSTRMPPTKLLSFLLLILLFPFCLHSQQVRKYIHTHFKTTDGLAAAIVNNAVQDHKGFIWLSTINGLQRFDGNKFLTFRNEKNNAYSLPSDDVTKVYEDGKKNLWVLTADDKAGIFNTSSFRYKEVPIHTSTSPLIHIQKQFIETPDGSLLLFLRSEKLYRYSPKAGAFVQDDKTIPFPKGWQVHHVAEDKANQQYWLVSDSGIAVFDYRTGHLNVRGNNKDKNPVIASFGNEKNNLFAYIDDKQLFLFQWPKGFSYYVLKIIDLQKNEAKQYDFRDEKKADPFVIKGFMKQSNGRSWVFGLPFLAEFKPSADLPFHFIKKDEENELGLKFGNIYSLYEDREKNVWVSSDNGLYVYNPDAHFFQNHFLIRPGEKQVKGRVQSALQLQDGSIWLGALEYGLFCYDRSLNPVPVPAALAPYRQNHSVWQMHQHSSTGDVWLALEGGKLAVYRSSTKKTDLLTPPVLAGKVVNQITEDKKGNLWFGTAGGLVIRWNFGPTNETGSFVQVMKSEKIQKLFTDKQGFIWAATLGKGLFKIDPEQNKVVYHATKAGGSGKSLWNNAPTDIIQYNDSTLLVLSDALNLLNVHNNKVTQISTYNGLPSNTALSVKKGHDGMLWLGMVSGLCKAQLEKNSFVIYDRNDGILDDNFNLGGAFRLADNRLLFTSEENFLAFDPYKLKYPNETNNVFITDIRLSNKSHSVDSLLKLDKVALSYEENSITIEFNALRYNKLNKMSYYYQLEGLDKDWIKTSGLQQAVYNYLPPGQYTFHVRTKNADGVFSEDEAKLSIRVYPPFWKAWWFYGILVLLLVLVLYLIDRERAKRREELLQMRSEIGLKLHEDISTTLNNINVLSQMARLKADRNIEKSKEFIEQIGDKSHSMAIAMDDMLWSIDPRNDGMEKTLMRILEFADALKNRHQAQIDVRLDDKLKSLELDMKVRYEFLLICKEALRCLVQYSECRRLLVNIDLAKNKIILKILSQGCELDPNNDIIIDSKKQISRRVAQINASFDFEINKDQTSIILTVPYRQHSRHGQLAG